MTHANPSPTPPHTHTHNPTSPANLIHPRGSQRVVPRLATTASGGNLLEIQTLNLSSIYSTYSTHTYSTYSHSYWIRISESRAQQSALRKSSDSDACQSLRMNSLQCCLTEFSVMMEITSYVCTEQHHSHWLHEAIEHLKCANEEMNF